MLSVVEWLPIKCSVMSDGVDSLMSHVELMNHDWFLWFVVIPTGTVTTVFFKLLMAMSEISSTATKVLSVLFC